MTDISEERIPRNNLLRFTPFIVIVLKKYCHWDWKTSNIVRTDAFYLRLITTFSAACILNVTYEA